MRTLIKVVVILAVLGTLGYFGFTQGQQWLAERNRPRFRTAKLETGDLRLTVNASGEVNPVLSVKIGSFVSGPIIKLYVEFNDEVKKDQLLAEIDPRLYNAALHRDLAALLSREADVKRVIAELQRAVNDEKRSLSLKAENPDFISQAELDQFRFSRMSLDAQLSLAEASVAQAKANLETSQANVGYTKILSPVDGVVIDRKIDPGQTLAAQFQAPELFVIAPDMRKKMLIFASVDEADIGLIKNAKDSAQPVFFTVDAYPGEIFDRGLIEQIRLSPKVTQSVVTYPVIVSTANPDLKLLPGMTAMLTFQISELRNILKIPNAALRFYPEKELVRESDQKLLELNITSETNDEDRATSSQEPPVDDAAKAAVAATKRIVWIQETEADAAEAAREKARQKDESTVVEKTESSRPAITPSLHNAEPIQTAATEPAATEPVATEPVATEPTLEPSSVSKAATSQSTVDTVATSKRPVADNPTSLPNDAQKVTAPAVKYTGKLKAVEIMIGDSDYQFTHVLSGNLKSGDEVIVGIKPPGTP